MTRLQAVRSVLDTLTDELLIVTTGFLSRDVFHLRDRKENFYMCGSMGNAYPIGMGIALGSPERTITVLSGDGAALMSLGSLVLGNSLKLPNLWHIIIDNKKYASTGGQPTCSDGIDFTQFHNTRVIHVDHDEPASPRITLDPVEIARRFRFCIR
ncbi:MAG: thiamine pyrophosphate-dependent enzyme [Candidatus Peribacteraceae bacterium]|nr:thiamine pyrophosphate-dependent enzyme [Candidatus Peribacteraceae bacterium]